VVPPNYYSCVFAFDTTRFTIIPRISAQAIEVRVTFPKVSVSPPIPAISIVETTNRFFSDLNLHAESS